MNHVHAQDTASGPGTAAPGGFRAAQRNALPGWIAAGAPVLSARREGIWLIVCCPFCGEEHRHGGCMWRSPCLPFDNVCLCPPGTGSGHRVEHCRIRPRDRLLPGYIILEEAA